MEAYEVYFRVLAESPDDVRDVADLLRDAANAHAARQRAAERPCVTFVRAGYGPMRPAELPNDLEAVLRDVPAQSPLGRLRSALVSRS